VRRFVNCVAAVPLNVIKFLIFMQMICTQAAMPFNPYPCHMLPLTPVLPTISWCMPKLLVSCCLIFQVLAAECFFFVLLFFFCGNVLCLYFFCFLQMCVWQLWGTSCGHRKLSAPICVAFAFDELLACQLTTHTHTHIALPHSHVFNEMKTFWQSEFHCKQPPNLQTPNNPLPELKTKMK